MAIYCLLDFKNNIEKLKKKNQYIEIEKDIIDYFFDKPIENLKTGFNINRSETIPYIKSRLNGSGGYRIYYLLLIVKGNVFLIHIHPKTGPYGSESLGKENIGALYNDVWEAIKSKELFLVDRDEKKTRLIFEAINKEVVVQ